MKLRKTRIKKITKPNGAVVYTAQYKGWVFWHNFNAFDGTFAVWSIYVEWLKLQNKEDVSPDQKHAKSLIDFYIARVNHKNASAIENEIVKTEYEKYP